MNVIDKSIEEVHYNIPREVLDRAFLDPRLVQRGVPVSLDTKIRSEVIDKRVRRDCDLYGAFQAAIPLAGLQPERLDPFTVIYRIPTTLTQGRSITEVSSVSFGGASHMPGVHHFLQNTSSLNNAVSQIFESNMPVPTVSTAYVQLIGENTILVEGELTLPRDIYLRCTLTHDSEMSSIKPASYQAFSKLVVLATKAHVYRNLQVALGQGMLHAGMDLGVFREVVESYSDANEMYYEFLEETWRATQLMNDESQWRRHLKLLIGSGR